MSIETIPGPANQIWSIIKIETPTKKVETIEDARRLKKNLERAIKVLVQNFEECTGLPVEAIEPRLIPTGAPFWRIKVPFV